jgi:hypothetical protein
MTAVWCHMQVAISFARTGRLLIRDKHSALGMHDSSVVSHASGYTNSSLFSSTLCLLSIFAGAIKVCAWAPGDVTLPQPPTLTVHNHSAPSCCVCLCPVEEQICVCRVFYDSVVTLLCLFVSVQRSRSRRSRW